MKKISKILSMVIVVGLIAAIPASTQILTGSRVASSDESNLPLLILVNRLELSEEQIDTLDDILTGLIGQKDELEGLASEFEQAMIEFNGTGEELDAMLVTFREEQLVSAEALRETIDVSLDEVRDLLSINQGLVLQEVFPQLLGGGALLGNDHSNGRLQGAAPMAEGRMSSTSMGRGSSRMSQQLPRGEQMAGRTREDVETMMAQRFGQTPDETTSERMQGRLGQVAVQIPEQTSERMAGRTREDAETMMAQRLGQVLDNEAMSTQVQERLERLGNQVPEQMIERFGEAGGKFGVQMEQGIDARNIAARGDLRQPGASSLLMQREQPVRDESGDLFGWLEQIANVLELKLDAMK